MYLGFNAAHEPFHAPPAELRTIELVGKPEGTPRWHYKAAVEALDTEIGRLLSSIPAEVMARTTVVFTADNGTPTEVVKITSPFPQGKATLYEGGVRVPLIVAGASVTAPGRKCASLVNSVDLFPTVAELFGVAAAEQLPDDRPLDGLSFAALLRDPSAEPARPWAYSEYFMPNGAGPHTEYERMLRDARWKLITRLGKPDQFFELIDGYERVDLVKRGLRDEQRAAYDALRAQLDQLVKP